MVSEVSYQLELRPKTDGTPGIESREGSERWNGAGTLWVGRGVKIRQRETLELELAEGPRLQIRVLSFWWQKGRFEVSAGEGIEELLAE